MTAKLARPRPLRVGDVMTSDVVTVTGSASFHEMASLMSSRGVSALPVVDAGGALVGIVSEADLLWKEAPPADTPRFLPESRAHRGEREKADAVNAAEVMTGPVVTVAAAATLATAARLMEQHRVKRLPVVDGGGALVGIVSRRDLLRVFTRSDEEIRDDVVDGVLGAWLGIEPGTITVSVEGGVVSLRGRVERRSDVEVVEHVVAFLDGVVAVDAELSYDFDDRKVRPTPEARFE